MQALGALCVAALGGLLGGRGGVGVAFVVALAMNFFIYWFSDKTALRAYEAQPLDAVGGMELGAYPIATSVSDAVFRATGAKIRAFVVRKEPK